MTEQKVVEGHRKRDSGCLDAEAVGGGVKGFSVGGRSCYDYGSFRKIRRATETIETSKGRPLYEISEQKELDVTPGNTYLSHGYPSFHRKGSRRSSAFTPKASWPDESFLRNGTNSGFSLSSIPSSAELLPRLNSFQDLSWSADAFGYSSTAPIKSEFVDQPRSFPNYPFAPLKTEAECDSGGSVIRKGAWTTEEDQLLISHCGSEEVKNWTDIAAHIPGRTAKQCRERWCFNLDPSINKDLWAPQEDLLLVQKQAEIGNKWAQIATLLPGRTENAVKTRFKSIIRAQKREWKPVEDQLLLSLYQKIGANWECIAKGMEAHRTKHAVKMRFKEIQAGLVHMKLPEFGSAKQTVREAYYPQARLPQISKYYQSIANEGSANAPLAKVLQRIPSLHNNTPVNAMNFALHKATENSFDQTLDDFLKIMSTDEEPLILA